MSWIEPVWALISWDLLCQCMWHWPPCPGGRPLDKNHNLVIMMTKTNFRYVGLFLAFLVCWTCPWTVHGQSMDRWPESDQARSWMATLSMDSPWTTDSLSTQWSTFQCGQSMDSPWTICGLVLLKHIDKSLWTRLVSMDCPWIVHGLFTPLGSQSHIVLLLCVVHGQD